MPKVSGQGVEPLARYLEAWLSTRQWKDIGCVAFCAVKAV